MRQSVALSRWFEILLLEQGTLPAVFTYLLTGQGLSLAKKEHTGVPKSMKLRTNIICGVFTAVALATSAKADIARVFSSGNNFDMHAAPIDNLFSDGSSVFNQADLLAIHNFVNQNGISTADMLTYILIGTGEGLAFVNLYDQPESEDDSTIMANLSWATSSLEGTGFISTQEMDDFGAGGIAVAATNWQWDTGSGAAGLAVNNFESGQSVMNFMNWQSSEENELSSPMPMQFLSWTGSDLEVMAEASASVSGQYAFGYMVTYLIPAPGALSLFVVAGLTRQRRRRRA